MSLIDFRYVHRRRGDQELVGERYRVSENNNTVLLNLHHVTRNDVGHYTLTAKNSAGEARRSFQIKVEDAGSDVPVFLRRLSDLAVKVGTRTRFLVEIRSSSEVKVRHTEYMCIVRQLEAHTYLRHIWE